MHAEVEVLRRSWRGFRRSQKSSRRSRSLARVARWPTDFLIHEASRGARAMGATRRYAGMRLEIERATSEDAAERQHAELDAARPGEGCGRKKAPGSRRIEAVRRHRRHRLPQRWVTGTM